MAREDDEIAVRENGLKKASSDKVWWGLFQQIWLGEVPVSRPFLEKLLPVLRSNQIRMLCEMGFGRKPEAARPPVDLGRWKYALKVLSFILRNPGIVEAANLRLFA